MRNLWVLFAIAALFISCETANIPRDIVGYWEGDTVPQDISFSADGRLKINDHKYSTYTGSYTITDGNVLTCKMDQNLFTEPIIKTVKIKGDKLTLIEKSRKEVYYRRK
jgi:hypothetical protein